MEGDEALQSHSLVVAFFYGPSKKLTDGSWVVFWHLLVHLFYPDKIFYELIKGKVLKSLHNMLLIRYMTLKLIYQKNTSCFRLYVYILTRGKGDTPDTPYRHKEGCNTFQLFDIRKQQMIKIMVLLTFECCQPCSITAVCNFAQLQALLTIQILKLKNIDIINHIKFICRVHTILSSLSYIIFLVFFRSFITTLFNEMK